MASESVATDERVAWWDFTTGDRVRDRENLGVVMETVGELYGVLDPKERMRRAVDRALVLAGAEIGILLRMDEKTGRLTPAVARHVDGHDEDLAALGYSSSAVRMARDSGQLIHSILAAGDDDLGLTENTVNLELFSVMAEPLEYGGRFLGVFYLHSKHRANRPFTETEKKVFRALGGLVAAALENTRLEEIRTQKVKQDLEIDQARQVQKGLVPKNLPTVQGIELSGQGRACELMSGDYYDAIPCADGRLGLVVGDVSGHGIPQALMMASARAFLHLLLEQAEDPGVTLSKLNQLLVPDMPERMFMTLFLGLYDPASRRLAYARGGHNLPLLWRKGEALKELDSGGILLGKFPEADYAFGTSVVLEKGDVVLLYTDGITEASAAGSPIGAGVDRGPLYGEARLCASFEGRAASGDSAKAILDGVLHDLDVFRGEGPLEDDITALVLKVVD